MALCVPCLILTVPFVSVGSVIVAFPGHIHFLNVAIRKSESVNEAADSLEVLNLIISKNIN